jgi:hypothetical protein
MRRLNTADKMIVYKKELLSNFEKTSSAYSLLERMSYYQAISFLGTVGVSESMMRPRNLAKGNG